MLIQIHNLKISFAYILKSYNKRKETFATFWHALWLSPHCPVAPASPSVDPVTVQQMMTERVRLPEHLQLLGYTKKHDITMTTTSRRI